MNGLVLVGIAIGGHEAVHGHVSRVRALNTAAGTLWMSVVLLPYSGYRRIHLEHHAWLNTDKDPEGNDVYPTLLSYLLIVPISGLLFIVFLWAQTITGAVRTSPFVRTPRQRRQVRTGALATVVLSGTLVVATIAFPVMRWIWLAPMLIGLLWWAPLVLTPEHYALGPESDEGAKTRTTRSNRIVRESLWNMSFHTAHHLAPGVAARRLPAFDGLLDDSLRPVHTSGYLRFQLDIVRALARQQPMAVPSGPAE